MIILQTAGQNSSPGMVGNGLFDQSFEGATTFRNNTYIHQLNRTLQAELRLVSAYSTQIDTEHFASSCETHQKGGKKLVRLIILNRGIPEEKAPLSTGITKQWMRLCRYLPAARMTISQLESGLLRHYDRLVDLAPSRDQGTIAELRREAQACLEKLAIN